MNTHDTNYSRRASQALVLLLTIAVALVLPATPAEAKAKATKVSVSASASKTTVKPNTVITVKGKAGKKAKRAKVVLQQRRNGGKWKNVKSTKTNNKRTYAVKVRVKSTGTYQYRVRVSKKKKVKKSYSRSVKVVSKKPVVKKPAPKPVAKPVAPYDPSMTIPMTAAEKADKDRFLKWANDQRAKNGLPPMVENKQLSHYNQWWANKEVDKASLGSDQRACATLKMTNYDECATRAFLQSEGFDTITRTIAADEWEIGWFDADFAEVDFGVGYAHSPKDGAHVVYYTFRIVY